MTRNEAAERLLDRTLEDGPPFGSPFWNGWDTAHDKIGQLLDDALAAEWDAGVKVGAAREHKATVERIRNGARALMFLHKTTEVIAIDALDLILDEEAAR